MINNFCKSLLSSKQVYEFARLTHQKAYSFAGFQESFQQKIANKTKHQYQMPEEVVQKIFKPKRSVQFYHGRSLIYLNKQNLLTPNLLQFHLLTPMAYLAYLIKINPWYLTFPAALPIMGFIQIFLFFRWVAHKKHNKYHVQRVYLLEDGQNVEVWFSNKIRRILKDNPEVFWLRYDQLKSPPDTQNQLPKRGFQFPTDLSNVQQPYKWNYGWTKYDETYQNYVFPKNYEYANWQILIPIFKGIKIDVSQCPKIERAVDEQAVEPTLQDGLKQIQKLKISEAQWEKLYGKLQYTKDQANKW